MRLLFMGTPEFAAVSLQHLIQAGHQIVGIVTQPDRPKGRGLELQPSAVKKVALTHHLPLWQPEQVSSESFMTIFRQLAPDVVVVVAFGQKIPSPILFEPKFGCINVHGSLLPLYRGAAPIQWSLLNGDPETGVTTMYMDEGWDTGDIIFRESLSIDPDENFGSLYPRMAQLGGVLLVKTLQAIACGEAPRLSQDHALASKAPKIKQEQQLIQWNRPAAAIHNQVRALAPFPGAETFFNWERLKIMETKLARARADNNGAPESLKPGTIIKIVKQEGIWVATADQPCILTQVQPSGKKPMAATDYANGRRLAPGMLFGAADPEK